MMNLIKVLVPFVGLVAASNHTNGTNGTTAAAAAATTQPATTAPAKNTTAAAKNATKAASGGDDNKSGNATVPVTVDVPVTISFGSHKPEDIVAALPSAADLAAIEISARRLSGNSTITKTQVKALLVASAKGFAKAIGGASANKKVSIKKVEAVTDGVKITFRVTLTGDAAKDSAVADKIFADVQEGSFKETLQTAVAAEVKADKTLGDAFKPTVKKIDTPVILGNPKKATTKAPSSSGAVSFVAPAGAMLMAMFALF